MDLRIRYEVCPACGQENPEKKSACPACDNRLFSDGPEHHQRYVALIQAEHRKRTLYWYGGWTLIFLVVVPPIWLLATGRFGRAPGIGALVAAMMIGWRLVDLKKKREGSARFLANYPTA